MKKGTLNIHDAIITEAITSRIDLILEKKKTVFEAIINPLEDTWVVEYIRKILTAVLKCL